MCIVHCVWWYCRTVLLTQGLWIWGLQMCVYMSWFDLVVGHLTDKQMNACWSLLWFIFSKVVFFFFFFNCLVTLPSTVHGASKWLTLLPIWMQWLWPSQYVEHQVCCCQVWLRWTEWLWPCQYVEHQVCCCQVWLREGLSDYDPIST